MKRTYFQLSHKRESLPLNVQVEDAGNEHLGIFSGIERYVLNFQTLGYSIGIPLEIESGLTKDIRRNYESGKSLSLKGKIEKNKGWHTDIFNFFIPVPFHNLHVEGQLFVDNQPKYNIEFLVIPFGGFTFIKKLTKVEENEKTNY